MNEGAGYISAPSRFRLQGLQLSLPELLARNGQGTATLGHKGLAMRCKIVAIVVMTTLMGTEGLAAGREWAVYREAGFSCILNYPAGLFIPQAVPPGKPRLFSSHDGEVYFRIQGMVNPDRWSPQTIRGKYVSANVPGDLTYERTRSDFVVLSGHRGRNIFYTKVAVSADRRSACILEITYPKGQKKALDRIVTRMSLSLRFVN